MGEEEAGFFRAAAHVATGADAKKEGSELLLVWLGRPALLPLDSVADNPTQAQRVIQLLTDNWAALSSVPRAREEAENAAMAVIEAACRTPIETSSLANFARAFIAWLRALPIEGPIHRCWAPEQKRTVEAAVALRLRRGTNRSAIPILFLYRHYLEIALKDALDRSKILDIGQSERTFGHDLTKLWEATRPVLTTFVDEDWLAPVGDAVELFNAVDRRADAFYATNPDGDPQMPKNAHVVYHELIGQMDDVHAAIELVLAEISREEGKMERAIEQAVARDTF